MPDPVGSPWSGPGATDGTGPHPRTLRWVEEVTGARVVKVRRLPGGLTSRVHAVTVRLPTAELVLREVAPTGGDAAGGDAAGGMVRREAAALHRLLHSAVPAPELVAVDAEARRTGHPALLVTLLPGAVRLGSHRLREHLTALAAAALAVHGVPVAPEDRPRPWTSWVDPTAIGPPAWAADPGVFTRAAAVLRGGRPGGGSGVLLHRDLHPGNVLFSGPPDGPVVTGVVDWAETSWGPADADLAHCRTNLAMLHGPPVAEAFRDAYLDAGGRLDPDRRRGTWWDLDDALGFLPDPAEVAAPWRELGRTDLSAAVVRSRLEAHVAGCLGRT